MTSSTTEQIEVLAPSPLSPATTCIFAAQATGAYAQTGLAVKVTPLSGAGAAPAPRTAESPLQLTLMPPAALLAQRDSGAPLLAVAKLTRQPLTYGDAKATATKPGPAMPAVLSVSRADASERGDAVRRFLQATGRACAADAKAGVKPWKAAGGKAKSGKQKTPGAALQPNLAAGDQPWGWQPPGQWTALVATLARQGTLKGAMSPDTAYSNEFLAGQGS